MLTRLLTPKSYSYHYNDDACVMDLKEALLKTVYSVDPSLKRHRLYLCIGSDRSTGDSLGPLVGTFLKRIDSSLLTIGSLDEPVHAMNLPKSIELIKLKYQDTLVIAIDASLGRYSRIGYINVCPGSLAPGMAFNKELPAVGDLSISGVVSFRGKSELEALNSTRLSLVYNMANIIAHALYLAQHPHMPMNFSDLP